MFGKLSLWAANTYHGPAIPKPDVHHMHHMPCMPDAQQAAGEPADAPAVAHHTPAACMFDPQGFNPVSFQHWTAEEKAQFIYDHRESNALLLILTKSYYSYENNYKAFLLVLQTGNLSDIIQYLSGETACKSVITYCMSSIWAEMLIDRYIQENAGHIKENLISWVLPSKLHVDHLDAQALLDIQCSVTHGNSLYVTYSIIPYVIQNNIPLRLKFTVDNYRQIIAAVKRTQACPKLMEFMSIFVTQPNVYRANFTEEKYESTNLANREVIHRQMAHINYGIAFVKFAERYACGIPPSLHAKWSQYAAVNGQMRDVIDTLQKPWNERQTYVICGLLNTPMMDEIYYMFQ